MPSKSSGLLTNKQLAQLKKKKKSKRHGIYFNNGEPLSQAIRKIFGQLTLILLIFVLITGGFFIKTYVKNYLSNDSVFTLTMSSKYNGTVSTYNVVSFENTSNSGVGAINAIAETKGLNSVSIDENTRYTNAMTKLLEDTFGKNNVESKVSVSNYTMMTEIYENLADGNNVIVLLAAPEKSSSRGDEEGTMDNPVVLNAESSEENTENEIQPSASKDKTTAKEISYGIVTSANYSEDEITVALADGSVKTLTAEDFVAATRFQHINKMSITENLELAFGLRSINTVYFIKGAES